MNVFITPWVELEFGIRPEGYVVFTDRDTCIASTREACKRGPYLGGYVGPVRPPYYLEVTLNDLEEDVQETIRGGAEKAFTRNYWTPPKDVTAVKVPITEA